jgi:hypothetical protein
MKGEIMKRNSALAVLVVLATFAPGSQAEETGDPLTADVSRWSHFIKENPSKDEMWIQIKDGSEPILKRAETALRDGRRFLALHRLSAVRVNLSASVYLAERGDLKGSDDSRFEAEWKRVGSLLSPDSWPPSTRAFDGVTPAAVRAIGEAALPQAHIYHEASLEYGRNTMPQYGLYYLGAALAQRDFVAFCRKLSAPSERPPVPIRSLRPELDALENEVLSAYRPPAAIDGHSIFITVSGTLKEARELDAAGLHHGALLRYLQAAARFSPLRSMKPQPEKAVLEEKLRDLGVRLSEQKSDSSIGRLFLELAQEDLADPVTPGSPAVAAAIVDDVLPRYFATLLPTSAEPSRPTPAVTVTLVRWPYT